MTKEKPIIKQLTIRFNWKVTLVIAISLLTLVRLGFWQLDRAELKRQIQTSLEQLKHAKPTPIEKLTAYDKQALNQQRVLLTGYYLNEKTIYVSNKFYQGRPGYELISAFKLKSKDQIILVSRGWIATPYQQNQLPNVDNIPGEQQLVGTIHLPNEKAFFLPETVEGKKWPIRLHHFHIDTVDKLFQTPIFPYIVRLELGNQGILQPFWPAIAVNSSQSTAYAIQWFIMALALIVVTIIRSTNIVQLIKIKQKNPADF